jgi:protein TonB
VPAVSDQAEAALAPDSHEADGGHTASTTPNPDAQALPEPIELAQSIHIDTLSPAEEEPAALGTPLDAETADDVENVSTVASPALGEAADLAGAVEAPAEIAEAAPPVLERPVVLASASALNPIADLLTTLQARAIASDTADAATEEVGDLLAGLPPAPPPVVASEKTEAARDLVADAAAALVPAPPPEPADTETKFETPEKVALAPAPPPPPLPRRKPEAPPAPKVAVSPPPAEVPPAPKATVAATPPRERQAAQPAPQQQTLQTGGLLGIWKPMALAPANEPAVSLSKPATARPSGKAYASQVWARLARYKPRAGQRGSASVSFAIGASGTLGAVRIARSSGNSRIDQLALQTVRNAAPFPRPPSGSASYTIRIDFH